jgi:hypothetical protein
MLHCSARLSLINKPKASSFEQLFVHFWRHKLHISVDTSLLNLLVGDRSGDNAGVGDQEPPGRYQQSRHLREKRVAVTKVDDDIQGDGSVE